MDKDESMVGWKDGRIKGWMRMEGLQDERMNLQMEEWQDERMNVRMEGCTLHRIDE